ncbi:MAG: hypothetical protein B7Y45_02890 [Sphingomonas sp. 28-66-16]|nr:MAG: hypothetical protein B7Y45_02890 [Sphingomonas sp. 28-66-16]
MDDPLLESAIDHFGRDGFDAASTRAIATAANVAMSTITYRHGGKEGLYLAAAGYIADQIGVQIRPVLDLQFDDPVEHVVALVGGMANLMLRDEAESWSRFIMREQMQPTAAFDLLWQNAMQHVVMLIERRFAEATGEGDPRAARIAAMTLIGQALVFRAARAGVLRALDRPIIDEADMAMIHARIETNVRAILHRSETR